MKYMVFDKVAENYDQTRFVPNELIKEFVEEIKRYVKKERTSAPYNILSIGIGTGRVEQPLATEEINVFGIDLSQKMLECCREREQEYEPFLCIADGCNLPFRDKFELGTIIHVIHLVEKTEQFMEEIKRITEKVVIGDIFTDMYTNPLHLLYCEILKEEKHELRKSTKIEENLEKMVKDRGWEMKKKEKSITTPLPLNYQYEIIKNKQLSSYWDIPDEIHKKVLERMEQEIKKRKINLEERINVNAKMILKLVEFGE